MKKYINVLTNKIISIYKYTKGILVTANDNLKTNGWYRLIGFELLNIVVTGLLISIALIPFLKEFRLWLSFSYGLIPWVVIQILVYAKRQLK